MNQDSAIPQHPLQHQTCDGQDGAHRAARLATRDRLTKKVEEACRLLARGDFAESQQRFQTLLETALRDDDHLLAEVASHNLAIAYRHARQWFHSEIWQQQSLAWRLRQVENATKESDDAVARFACDLTGRGCDAFLKQQWEIAESLWRRALAIEEWRGSWQGQAADCGNLGLLAAARGNLEEGIRWLRKSLRMHRLMLDEAAVGTDLMNLAELYRLKGDIARTIRLLERSVQSFERADALPLRHRAEHRLREAFRIDALSKLDPRIN